MKKFCQFIILFICIQVITAASQKCITCNSQHAGQNCINTNGTVLSKRCDRPDSCYTRVVDGLVQRGCSEDLEPTVLRNCGPNSDCQLCTDDDCNAGLYPAKRLFCHMCDDATDCKMAREGTPTPCLRYRQDDECIVRKKGDNTVRQCLSDYLDCSKESSCIKCNFHGCNNEVYNSAATFKNSMMFILIAYIATKLF